MSCGGRSTSPTRPAIHLLLAVELASTRTQFLSSSYSQLHACARTHNKHSPTHALSLCLLNTRTFTNLYSLSLSLSLIHTCTHTRTHTRTHARTPTLTHAQMRTRTHTYTSVENALFGECQSRAKPTNTSRFFFHFVFSDSDFLAFSHPHFARKCD